MFSSTLIKLQDAAQDVANLALVDDVPAKQWQATVERYRAAKTAHETPEPEVVHYTYSTPVYNGLYTSGHITAFCGVTGRFNNGFESTEARSYVTCAKCLAEVKS